MSSRSILMSAGVPAAVVAAALILGFGAHLTTPTAKAADGPLYTLTTPNPQANAHFGAAVASADVNGDGKADIIVGAYNETVGANDWQGRVYVFSGADDSLLRTFMTPNPQMYSFFGGALASGDVNGDGKADIIVGALGESSFQGRAYVFSGANGSLLRTLNTPNPQAWGGFGGAVAAGDVNGDGKADIIIGANGETVGPNTGEGRAYAFSGQDGSLLRTLNTPNTQAGAGFGGAVASADLNGDGKADIIVAAYVETIGANTGQGRVYVFSGANGSLLRTLNTPNPQANAHFGVKVVAGDVNGDGRVDIVVGAPDETVGANTGQGRLYVFSGTDGSLLQTLTTANPQADAGFGARAVAGDVNGDGKADIIVGAGAEWTADYGFQGRAYVFSGANGSLLRTLNTPNPQADAAFGSAVALGDVNGDGTADLVVGALGEAVGVNAGQGRAYVFSGSLSSASVGGIAEQPDVTALQSSAASSGRDHAVYILGAVIALLLAVVGTVRWCRQRP